MFPVDGMFAHTVGDAGQDAPRDRGPLPWGAGNVATCAWDEHPKTSFVVPH